MDAEAVRALADELAAAPTATEAAAVLAERLGYGAGAVDATDVLILPRATLVGLVRDLTTYPFACPPDDSSATDA